MANVSSFIVLDVETGGLNPVQNALTEIAAISFAGDTYTEIGRVDILISPYDKEYNPAALNVTGITLPLLEKEGVPVKEAARQLLHLFEKSCLTKAKNAKSIIVGHNVLFDIGFIRQLLNYIGDAEALMSKYLDGSTCTFSKLFQPRYIDTMNLGKQAFGHEAMDKIKDWKLSTLFNHMGLEAIDSHRAMNDVEVTKKMFIDLSERMRMQSVSVENNNSSQSRLRDFFRFGPVKAEVVD